MTEGLIGLAAMMAIAFCVPIALAIGAGIVGYAYMRDWAAIAFGWRRPDHETGRNYTLSVVPLFILMGNFVTRAGCRRSCSARPMPLATCGRA
jgi:hypothetical protein